MGMNRIATVVMLLLLAGAVAGQSLKQGTIVECNEISVVLHPGKTLQEYANILVNRLAPAIELAYPDTEVFFVMGNRGNAESKVGAIWVFESDEIWSRYYDPDGNPTAAGRRASEQLDPIRAELNQVGTGTRMSRVWEIINEPRSAATAEYFDYLVEYSSKVNYDEVPVHPSAMGISDPLLENVVEELDDAFGELKSSGLEEGDPQYSQYTSRIDALKESINETAIPLAAAESRAFQKGGSFGYHKITVSLAQDVTMDQYLQFWTDQYFPEFVKLMKGVEVLILVPHRAPLEDQFVYVYYFRSQRSRDRYWPEPDTPSDHTNAAMEQLKPLFFELLEMGTWEDDYGVWIIQ